MSSDFTAESFRARLAGLSAAEAEHGRVEGRVVAGAQILPQIDPEFDERSQPPLDPDPSQREAITNILFSETTTLGVRYTEWQRSCLQREWRAVETPYGTVRVKVGLQDGEIHGTRIVHPRRSRRRGRAGRPRLRTPWAW